MRGFPCNEHFTYAFLIHLNYAARLSTGYINVLRVFLLGYWSITVYGRKHCYRLYTKHFNEAVHWACATQKIIDTKAPVETPTQLLIRDIEVGHSTLTSMHSAAAKRLNDMSHQTHYSFSALSPWKPHWIRVQSFLCLPFSFQ